MLRLGIALTLITAVIAAAGCGGGDETASTTPRAAATPAATPLSTIDFSDLEPGATYVSKQFRPPLTFTVPKTGGWKLIGADSPDHVELEPVVEDPVDSSAVGFHHMTKVFPPAEGGTEPGDAVDGPADFAKWLTEHPHLKTTEPEPVEALGLKGVSIDVRVKSSQPRKYKDCGKLAGECVVMFVGKIEPLVWGSQSFGRFYVLEQPDGGQLVVEQYIEPASAVDEQLPAFEEFLASATTG